MGCKRQTFAGWTAVVLTALLLLPSVAGGQETPSPAGEKGSEAPTHSAEGFIIEVRGREVVIDLGTRQGLAEGMAVQILSKVSVVHPVTKKKMEDRIPLGLEVVTRAGETLSVIVLQNTVPDKLKPGDMIRAEGLSPMPDTVEPTAEAPECPACQDDPDAMKVHKAWLATISLPLEERVVKWTEFLKANPESSFKRNIMDELTFLRRTLFSRHGKRAKPAREGRHRS